jgi:guanylate kinase
MPRKSKKQKGKVLIFTAPSGSGKTTIVRYLLSTFNFLGFSVSATTRAKRPHEVEGKDYYFLSHEEFKKRIKNRAFVEWEEVYADQYYGTLKSEVDRVWNEGKHIVFDIEVNGATNIKKLYGDRALAVFIKVPTLQQLVKRLKARKTETEANLKKRIKRIKKELTFEKSFDLVLINDDLDKTLQEAESMVTSFLGIKEEEK